MEEQMRLHPEIYKNQKSRDMIKDFNSFITEDKEYNEIFTLVVFF